MGLGVASDVLLVVVVVVVVVREYNSCKTTRLHMETL